MTRRDGLVLLGALLVLAGGSFLAARLTSINIPIATPDPAQPDAPPPKYRGRAADRQDSASAFAFSPDGATLATGDAAGTVLLSDATTGAAKLLLETDGTPVRAVAYSPDGKMVAASVGGAVWAWEVTTGRRAKAPPPVEFRPFQTDRERWERANGRTLALPEGVIAAALSPDGKTVAWADAVEQAEDHFGFPWFTPRWRVAATAGLGRAWTWADARAKLKDAPHRATRLEAIRWMVAHAKDPQMKEAGPVLEDRLRHDPDWRVREKAALRLVAVQKKHSPYPLALLEAFRDPDLCVRTAARYPLTEYTNYPPGAVDDLLKSATFAESFETRAEALRRLAVICEVPVSAVRAVAGGLVPPHPDAGRVLKAITVAMADGHPEVRRTAAQAHARVSGTVDADILWLIRYTDDPEAVWPLDTPDEMEEFGVTAESKRVARNLRQLGTATRLAAVCTERPAEVAGAMLRGLNDPDPAVRKAVAVRVRVLAAVPESTVIQSVIPVYGISENLAQLWIVPPIGFDPPAQTTTELGDRFKPASETVLPELLTRGVEAKLKRLAADDSDERVRAAARAALEELKVLH